MSDRARHLGGCLLARAPDLVERVKAGARMKPDLVVFIDLGSFAVPWLCYPLSSSVIRDDMGIHGNQ